MKVVSFIICQKIIGIRLERVKYPHIQGQLSEPGLTYPDILGDRVLESFSCLQSGGGLHLTEVSITSIQGISGIGLSQQDEALVIIIILLWQILVQNDLSILHSI